MEARGLRASLRVLGGALVALASTRLDLAATELEEEGLRLAELALWAVVALFFLAVGIVFAGLLLVLLAWQGPREWVLGGLTAVFISTGLLAAATCRRMARSKPPLLQATRAELRADAQALAGSRASAE